MKIRDFIFCSWLVMLVVSCSEIDSTLDPVTPGSGFEQDIFSEVPIEFGYGGMTKAPMTTESLSEKNNFGLFSVEEGVEDLRMTTDLNLRNAIINYRPGYGFVFGKKSETCFYPEDPDKRYSFYAYYSYRNDEDVIQAALDDEVIEAERAVKVRFYSYMTPNKVSSTLGSHNGDVLYSKARKAMPAEDGSVQTVDAFNAPIVRKYGNPEFQFRHVCALLHFTVTLDLTRSMGDYFIRVAGLRIKNSPAQADMWLVNLDDPSKEGTFDPNSFVFAKEEGQIPFLRNESGSSGALNFDIPSTFTNAPLGAAYMFIPPQKEPLKCILSVARVNETDPKANETYYYEFELDPEDYDEDLTSGHEAGMQYNYNIVLDWGHTSNGSVGPIVRNAKQVLPQNWKSIE